MQYVFTKKNQEKREKLLLHHKEKLFAVKVFFQFCGTEFIPLDLARDCLGEFADKFYLPGVLVGCRGAFDIGLDLPHQ